MEIFDMEELAVWNSKQKMMLLNSCLLEIKLIIVQ